MGVGIAAWRKGLLGLMRIIVTPTLTLRYTALALTLAMTLQCTTLTLTRAPTLTSTLTLTPTLGHTSMDRVVAWLEAS